MNKKGELTTQQIVMLIILIASFAVILFFIFRLGLGEEQEREVCHNSVLMKGNALIPDEAAPLNCKKQYVCISADKTCEGMTDPILKKVKTKNETFEALAEEMADCWWMFGEGEINYAGKGFASKLSCALCDQIIFDDSMKKIFPSEEIDKKEFYEFLTKQEFSNGETYSQYLFGGVTSVDQIYQGEDSIPFLKSNGDFRRYYILTGMAGEVSTLKWILIGAGSAAVIAGGLALAPFTGGGSAVVASSVIVGTLSWAGGTAATVGVAAGITGSKFIAPVLKGKFGDLIPPSIIEANSPEFVALNCSVLATYA